jgi:hypothetical protein
LAHAIAFLYRLIVEIGIEDWRELAVKDIAVKEILEHRIQVLTCTHDLHHVIISSLKEIVNGWR